jgi:hypothetical protein
VAIPETNPLAVDREFFEALLSANVARLGRLLADDFLIVDVMSGSETGKAELIAALGSGRLKFQKIASTDNHVRNYGGAAVVNGRTEMNLSFDAMPITVKSRYTHVYISFGEHWRMVSAQGTRIAE